MQVMVDADFIIEGLLNQSDFARDCEKLFEMMESGKINAYITQMGLEKIRSWSSHFENDAIADELISLLQEVVQVCPITNRVWDRIKFLKFLDPESMIEAACALEFNIPITITNNPQNFADCNLSVFSVCQLLDCLYPVELTQNDKVIQGIIQLTDNKSYEKADYIKITNQIHNYIILLSEYILTAKIACLHARQACLMCNLEAAVVYLDESIDQVPEEQTLEVLKQGLSRLYLMHSEMNLDLLKINLTAVIDDYSVTLEQIELVQEGLMSLADRFQVYYTAGLMPDFYEFEPMRIADFFEQNLTKDSQCQKSAMTHPNSKLLERLKNVSDGLRFMSESEASLEPFLWEAKDDEILSAENLLQRTNHPQDTPIEVIDFDKFFEVATTEQEWHESEERKIVKKFQELVNTLKYHLSDLKVYRLGCRNRHIYIIGRTMSRDYAGLFTKVL